MLKIDLLSSTETVIKFEFRMRFFRNQTHKTIVKTAAVLVNSSLFIKLTLSTLRGTSGFRLVSKGEEYILRIWNQSYQFPREVLCKGFIVYVLFFQIKSVSDLQFLLYLK